MRNLRSRTAGAGLVVVAGLAMAACGSMSDTSSSPSATDSGATGSGDYVNVAKLTGIAWFDRMAVGVSEFADATGETATQTGPSTASTEQQVSIIQGLIAKKPAALSIVPLDPDAVQNVVDQAEKAGIVVVSHEAPSLTNVDADIEAFDNVSYGESIMSGLAECMGGEGKYVQFVGSLTSETHMAWTDAATALQKKEYPGLERISDPVESNDNADTAYEKTKALLQSNPDLVGFEGASSQDLPGIARAVEEAGLQDDTCVYGTGVPSETASFLDSGAADSIYLWDPAAAGEATLYAAQLFVRGEKLKEGTDLGVEGYESLRQAKDNPKVWYGDAQLTLTKDNVGDYDF